MFEYEKYSLRVFVVLDVEGIALYISVKGPYKCDIDIYQM